MERCHVFVILPSDQRLQENEALSISHTALALFSWGLRYCWTHSRIKELQGKKGGREGRREETLRDLLHGHGARTGGREENWKLIGCEK